MSDTINWGSVYAISWFGSANEDVSGANGWGSIYPFDADGSFLRADTTDITSDTTIYKADATQY